MWNKIPFLSQIDRLIDKIISHNRGNIFLLVLPLLFFYIFLILSGAEDSFRKDEWRYIFYARQLLSGEYSPTDTVFLWNGPGYPLLIAPFLATGLPFIFIKLLNGLFLYLSVILVHLSLRHFFSISISFWVSILIGIYVPFFEMLPFMMTEPFSIFLIGAITYLAILIGEEPKLGFSKILLLGLAMAFFALTKVIFGYVILVLLFLLFIKFIITKNREIKPYLIALLLALFFCLPYLFYTYKISGKVFYWSNAGGMQLYWMSTPHPDEYGNWINITNPVSKSEQKNQVFKKRHEAIILDAFDIPEIFKKLSDEDLIVKSNLRQDELFKQYALTNIKTHPLKFIKNCGYNLSRMLFGYPYSYHNFSRWNLKFVLANIPLLLLIFYSIFRQIKGRISLPFSIQFLVVFVLIYLGGSVGLSAYPRQFYIIVPILVFWIAWISGRKYQRKL